jgi:plasmid stabilization system protein ParE
MSIWSIIVEKQGVVSLLDMLEFAARDYLELAHQIGLFMGFSCGRKIEPQELTEGFPKLVEEANRLGLVATREHLAQFVLELVKENPGKAKFLSNGLLQVSDSILATPRLCHHIEAIYTSLRAELDGTLLKAIPREKNMYCGSAWLANTKIPGHFPSSFTELQRAGNCYAFGQPTACVFHSMRALEPCLNSLADHFGISFSQENWQKIIQEIETKVRSLGNQPKSQQKLEDEKFFGNATAELYFVKNAWRNHVVHTRDSYSDDEALRVMQHTVQFVESLCPKLSEPT